ncbi:MAG: MFS transporter [Rhodocyclaceae bacterium]|nr:MFS transporter [Rhodocyclaceae bacterium]MCA3089917.1 MFS transporter [Rhodocyclaceae bacterium]MCA3093565.1 MFS transporter [Rhodocyclaceae bacterium]MCA3096382.1 MFS transporter [Rhodocyclaceae bacterium]MCA3101171.1 MFS transporter [Rhodocyclaceae bacterium]
MKDKSGDARLVAILGTAQTLAWASSYYLPAMLAGPMAADLGISPIIVFAAFSFALLVSALIGPLAGRMIDSAGGRPVLAAASLAFAGGLVMLALAQDAVWLFLGWAVIGLAMGSGLYEAAFSTLVRLRGSDARATITGITLIAGFASTVGWPLSAVMETHLGWRGACVGWALLHLVVGLPLNLSLPRATRATDAARRADRDAPAQPEAGAEPVPVPGATLAAILLAFVFAVTWFISTAMAAHLPRLLQEAGASLAMAVALGAIVGPAQVAARLLEFGFLRHVHPLLSARLAALGHPLGVVLLAAGGTAFAPVFVLLHGAGNGILTIAKGTLPLVLFGPQGYGLRQGWLTLPARLSQAIAPLAFGAAIDRWGAGALWLSALLGAAALGALLLMPKVGPR